MWCFVSEPSSGIIHEYKLSRQSCGHNLLEKVCSELGLVEKDYFGLNYQGKRGERLWLNLRNPLVVQLRGRPPYRLVLLAKFFVHPQELQQPITRHQFYLTVKDQVVKGHYEMTEEETIVAWSYMAQVELGDRVDQQFTNYSRVVPNMRPEHQHLVAEAHGELAGCSSSSSEIHFLTHMYKHRQYGVEYFQTKSENRQEVMLGISCLGVELEGKEGTKLQKRIHFEDISRVSYHHNRFIVHYYECHQGEVSERNERNENTSCLKFILASRQAAQALFRAFTETHTFFKCDRVEAVVRQQHSHTGFGSIVALMLPSTAMGKIYQFDIHRTRRQAYNHAWNKLHPDSSGMGNSNRMSVESNFGDVGQAATSGGGGQEVHLNLVGGGCSGHYPLPCSESSSILKAVDACLEEVCRTHATTNDKGEENGRQQEGEEGTGAMTCRAVSQSDLLVTLRNEVIAMKEARLCQVCLDLEIATAFCPCGHMMCCENCSVECRKCPLCRSEVTYAQRIFFPCD